MGKSTAALEMLKPHDHGLTGASPQAQKSSFEHNLEVTSDLNRPHYSGIGVRWCVCTHPPRQHCTLSISNVPSSFLALMGKAADELSHTVHPWPLTPRTGYGLRC
jgi:hypothetical protein